MERIDQIAGDIPGWGPPANGARARWGSPLLPISALAVAALLFWSTYEGYAELGIALLVAGGFFVFVVSRPELGILIIISTMLLTYPDILQGSGFLTPNNLLGGVLFLILTGKVFASRDLWFLREKEIKILFLLGLLFLVSTAVVMYTLPKLRFPMYQIRGPIRDLTLPWLQDFFTRGIAFVILFLNFITSRKHVKYVLLTLLACILIAIPSAYQAYMSGELDPEELRVTAGSALGGGAGWLSNPNRFAFMCLLGISLLFYFAITTRRRSVKLLVIPGIMSLTALVLLAGSRSGLLGLFLMGAWLFTRGTGVRREIRAAVLLLGVSVAITFFLLLPPRVQVRLLNLNPLSPHGEGSHSIERRKATIEESLAVFAQHPVFGVGLGNFRWFNKYLHDSPKPPHNSYLWALAEGGIFVLLLYLILFSCLFKRLRLIRQEFREDPVLPYIGEFMLLYLILFLFFSLFADVWLSEVHLYLITGLSIVLQRLASEKRELQAA